MSRPAIGSRVELVADVERYPHFIAPAGATGVVVDLGDPGIVLAVRLDEPLAGAEDWRNEVHWHDGDAELNDMSVDEYLALYVREVEAPPAPTSADFVRHDAIAAASIAELRGILRDGGPTVVIDAARAELERRGDKVDEADESERAYEIASADVVLALSRDDAETIADGLDLLRDIAEGNDPGNDYYIGTLARLAHRIRVELEARS
jgi:hypothetical protein